MNNRHDTKKDPVIIIKRVKKRGHGHHGGSWKIAYADFVTAMMAFFLLMWLLSLMNKYQLEGIAQYFKKPLKEVFSRQDNIQSNVPKFKPDHVGPAMDNKTGYTEMGDNTAFIGSGKNHDTARSSMTAKKLKSEDKKNIVVDNQASSPQNGPTQQTLNPTAKPPTTSGMTASTDNNTQAHTAQQQQNQTQSQQNQNQQQNPAVLLQNQLNQQQGQQGQQNQNQQQSQQAMTQQQIQQKMEDIKKNILNDINKDKDLAQYKNMLNFVVTADGLKINLHELQGKTMFSNGKTDFQDYAKKLLKIIAKELNKYPNQVEIIGHTDSVPYTDDQFYSNWDLSASRASTVRRILVGEGMGETKILRVIGVADALPLKNTNPFDATNRRIEIVILNDQAAKNIKKDDN